jgi:outer membrane protein OmpA-like peptidoglycan-associated protein
VKKIVLFYFILTLPIAIFSQTKIKSFYFENDQSIPTPYSQNQLELFKQSLIKEEVVILEIYSYTDSLGSNSYNNILAEKRLTYIATQLNLIDNSFIQLKPYGLTYKYDVKDFKSWRRVDIYYELLVYQDSVVTENQDEEVSPMNDSNPIDEAIKDALPFILNISFKEGTAKIELNSFAEIKKLADYLNTHPATRNVVIRGHVCCGNNMYISKNRAKAVYKELQKMGVEKSRLSYKGMSNKDPLVFPEKTNADRQKNRRVDIVFNTIIL